MKCVTFIPSIYPTFLTVLDSQEWKLSQIDWFSLGPVEGGCTGGVGTQVRSWNEVQKVPECPQGFLGFRGSRVLAKGTRWCT